jgi:hypothetical protein
MSRIYVLIIVLIAAVGILAACTSEESRQLPTEFKLPTVTQTFTPSATFTPTRTPVPTFTPTPTSTLTFTPTATATVTSTFVPTLTYTSTLTLTPSLTPTFTFTPTPPEPVITSYTTSATSTEPGKQITLTWQTQAERARIERLNVAGNIVESFPVETNGTMTVTIPGGEARAIYRLVAVRAGRETSLSLAIAVAAICPATWFFTPPASAAGQPPFPCPTGAAVSAPGAYQAFQQGFMFRVQVNNLNKVCGIQFNINRYTCYPAVAYNGTPPATPPAGFQPPGADFADAFYNQLAIGGYWYTIIGWGTSLMTTGNFMTQSDANGLIYIQLPAGIYKFDGQLSSGEASKVQ